MTPLPNPSLAMDAANFGNGSRLTSFSMTTTVWNSMGCPPVSGGEHYIPSQAAATPLQHAIQKPQQNLRFGILRSETALKMTFGRANRLGRQSDIQPLLQTPDFCSMNFESTRSRISRQKCTGAWVFPETIDNRQQAMDSREI